MKQPLLKIILTIVPLLLFPETSQAGGRAVNVGLGYQSLLGESLGNSALSGVTLPLTYEFELSPRFNLGIHLGYRFAGSLHQLSYGLLMKHYFEPPSGNLLRPYLEYGLLLLNTRVTGRTGAGTSHETALTVGTDLNLSSSVTRHFFAELSYRYSRLSYFEPTSEILDCLQLVVGHGWRFE